MIDNAELDQCKQEQSSHEESIQRSVLMLLTIDLFVGDRPVDDQ